MKVTKGSKLGEMLRAAVEAAVTDERSAEQVVELLARVTGGSVEQVQQLLSGEAEAKDEEVLRTIALALGVSGDAVVAAAKEDAPEDEEETEDEEEEPTDEGEAEDSDEDEEETDDEEESGKSATKGYLFERKGVLAFSTKAINDDKRTIDAIVSTVQVDRDGEIVEPKSFKQRLASFLRNPVMLWSHDPFQPPIGKVTKLVIHDDRIEATFQFRPEGESELADDVWLAYRGGFLTSFSIGFRVFRVEESNDPKTGKALPLRVVDAELFEISAVTIPSNTDAVVRADRVLRRVKSALYGQHSEAKTIYSTPTNTDVLKRATVIVTQETHRLTDQERKAFEDLQLALFCSAVGEMAQKQFNDEEAAARDLLAALGSATSN